MQIDTKRYLVEMGFRPTLTADVVSPANPMQPLCGHQGERSAARTAFLNRRIASKHDDAVAMLETRDATVSRHAAVLPAAATAVAHLKEPQGRPTESFRSPLGPRVSVFRAFVPPGMEPPGPPG
jgi:hypothetical protein